MRLGRGFRLMKLNKSIILVLMTVFLFSSCNALKLITGGETKVDPNFSRKSCGESSSLSSLYSGLDFFWRFNEGQSLSKVDITNNLTLADSVTGGVPMMSGPRGNALNCAGQASTIGFLNAPVSYDYFSTFISILNLKNFSKIQKIFDIMKDKGLKTLLRSNENKKNIKFITQADMRHKGQGHEILVDLPERYLIDKDINKLKSIFYKNYETVYGFSHKELDIEITKLRLKAVGNNPNLNLVENEAINEKIDITREIYLGSNKSVTANIYKRNNLNINKQYSGPAIIEEIDSTVVIPELCSFIKDKNNNIIAKFIKK